MIVVQHYSLASTEDACVVVIDNEDKVCACITSFVCENDSFVFSDENITAFLKNQNFNSGKNIFSREDYLKIDNNEDRFDFILDNLSESGLIDLFHCVTNNKKQIVIHRNVNTN